MKLRTYFSTHRTGRWLWFISSTTFVIGSSVIWKQPLYCIAELPLVAFMWKLIEWGVEYQ